MAIGLADRGRTVIGRSDISASGIVGEKGGNVLQISLTRCCPAKSGDGGEEKGKSKGKGKGKGKRKRKRKEKTKKKKMKKENGKVKRKKEAEGK